MIKLECLQTAESRQGRSRDRRCFNNTVSLICFRVNQARCENKELTSIAVLDRLRGVALSSFFIFVVPVIIYAQFFLFLLFHLEQLNHLRFKSRISLFAQLEMNIARVLHLSNFFLLELFPL